MKTKRKEIPEHLKFDTDRYSLYAVKSYDPTTSKVDTGEFVQIQFVVVDTELADVAYPLSTATTFIQNSYMNNGKWRRIVSALQQGYVLKLQENLKGFWSIKEETTRYRCQNKDTMIINADNSFQVVKQWLKDDHGYHPLFSLLQTMHIMGVELDKQNDVIDLNQYLNR